MHDAAACSSLHDSPANRLVAVSENAGGTARLVEYDYLGMSTIVRESRPMVSGGLNLSYGSGSTYAGFDRFGRVVSQEWRKNDSTLVDGYSYTYDRAGNRTSKVNLLNSTLSEAYTYDGLDRLVGATRNGVSLQGWELDALGNWDSTTTSGGTQTRTHNEANEITDISGDWTDPTHDAAGNVIEMPPAAGEVVSMSAAYDAWNRLASIGYQGNVTCYLYDGLSRLVTRLQAWGDPPFALAKIEFYYNEQNQIIETTAPSGSPTAQYVYSLRYIDAAVMMYRYETISSSGDPVYTTQDANFNVTATVNGDTGAVVNRFIYTPYGARTVLTAAWTAGTTDFMLGHQGLMLDSETGMYYNRARFYHPTLGRFVQRDPLGYVDGGSLYEYVRSGPVNRNDPGGTNSTAKPTDESVQHVPPDSLGDGITGEADCDPATGVVWVKVADDSVTSPCTARHEQVHQRQLTPCCQKYAEAYKKASGDAEKQARERMWRAYKASRKASSEAEAYGASVACAEELYGQKNCTECEEKAGDMAWYKQNKTRVRECTGIREYRDGCKADRDRYAKEAEGEKPIDCPFA